MECCENIDVKTSLKNEREIIKEIIIISAYRWKDNSVPA